MTRTRATSNVLFASGIQSYVERQSSKDGKERNRGCIKVDMFVEKVGGAA
jgi:hypothetical protein